VARSDAPSFTPNCSFKLAGVADGAKTYEAAGVSLATAEALVERLRAAVESTGARGFGAFAGLQPIDEKRLLAASTDSVGTKLIVARERGALRNCGADLAAHCINDVITTGADPLLFLDYFAANRVDLEHVAELVEAAAEVCRSAGCALVGGETAELPGIYRDEELDFAGTCVGVVDRDRLVDGRNVSEGDSVVGLASAGVHANGFTLIRQILQVDDYDGEDLLAPTRLYLDEVRRLRGEAHAFAHVTGGGIAGNLARVVPEGLRAEIDWNAWERPPVFDWLGRHVEEGELRRVFNLGIGFCAVVADPGGEPVIGRIERA
jgi:phosphoribosylformylglycinamidine cyclo-ligase